jgi:hypothetical protein
MIKRIIYFVLSILAIGYIAALVGDAIGLVSPAVLGEFATVVRYFISYGGVVIIFMYACTNFTGNIFKILLFVLLLVMAILFAVVQIPAVNEFFRSILGLL